MTHSSSVFVLLIDAADVFSPVEGKKSAQSKSAALSLFLCLL